MNQNWCPWSLIVHPPNFFWCCKIRTPVVLIEAEHYRPSCLAAPAPSPPGLLSTRLGPTSRVSMSCWRGTEQLDWSACAPASMDLDINISLWIYDMYDSVWGSVSNAWCWSMLGKGLGASIYKLSYVTQVRFAALVELFTRSVMASSTVKNKGKIFPKLNYDETSLPRSGPKLWDRVISTSAFSWLNNPKLWTRQSA